MTGEGANMNLYIRNSYADLLRYYRTAGIGKKSDITGVIIKESLIKTIERRYVQLGGSLNRVYRNLELPSNNGSI